MNTKDNPHRKQCPACWYSRDSNAWVLCILTCTIVYSASDRVIDFLKRAHKKATEIHNCTMKCVWNLSSIVSIETKS
jgi:hypothetical protein